MRTSWTVPLAQTLVDISEDADLTAAFSIEAADSGTIYIPSTFDGTKFIVHVSNKQTGTFQPVGATTDGVTVEYTVAASHAYPLPTGMFGSRWAKIETVTDQATTDTQLIVTLSG
jgi:hypothetical protein